MVQSLTQYHPVLIHQRRLPFFCFGSKKTPGVKSKVPTTLILLATTGTSTAFLPHGHLLQKSGSPPARFHRSTRQLGESSLQTVALLVTNFHYNFSTHLWFQRLPAILTLRPFMSWNQHHSHLIIRSMRKEFVLWTSMQQPVTTFSNPRIPWFMTSVSPPQAIQHATLSVWMVDGPIKPDSAIANAHDSALLTVLCSSNSANIVPHMYTMVLLLVRGPAAQLPNTKPHVLLKLLSKNHQFQCDCENLPLFCSTTAAYPRCISASEAGCMPSISRILCTTPVLCHFQSSLCDIVIIHMTPRHLAICFFPLSIPCNGMTCFLPYFPIHSTYNFCCPASSNSCRIAFLLPCSAECPKISLVLHVSPSIRGYLPVNMALIGVNHTPAAPQFCALTHSQDFASFGQLFQGLSSHERLHLLAL